MTVEIYLYITLRQNFTTIFLEFIPVIKLAIIIQDINIKQKSLLAVVQILKNAGGVVRLARTILINPLKNIIIIIVTTRERP